MKLQQLFEDVNVNTNDVFEKDTTGMPNYDDMIQNPEYFKKQKGKDAQIVTMSPDEYIKKVLKGFNTSLDKLMSGRDKDKINKFADQMKNNGKKFPILTLDYTGSKLSQEGVHRALAANKAGIKQVPVLVVNNIKK